MIVIGFNLVQALLYNCSCLYVIIQILLPLYHYCFKCRNGIAESWSLFTREPLLKSMWDLQSQYQTWVHRRITKYLKNISKSHQCIPIFFTQLKLAQICDLLVLKKRFNS